MATILRPPLVSNQQRKLPIGTADVPGRRSLALLTAIQIQFPLAAEQVDDSSPIRKRQVRVDVYPNLLTSTLAPLQVSLPTGKQWFESAPLREPQTLLGQLIQGFIVDNGPEPLVRQLSDSAPQRADVLRIEQYTNLLTATLAVSNPYGLPLSAEQVDDSAQPRKRQVFADWHYRPLTLGVNPNAAIAQLSDSATPRKAQVQDFIVQNLLGTTLSTPLAALALPLSAVRSDWAAPQAKHAVYAEQQLGLLGTTLAVVLVDPALPQLAVRWDLSAPQVRPRPQVDQQPRLVTLDPVGVLALPQLAVRWDVSAPQVRPRQQVDQLPRLVTLDPVPRVQRLDQSATPLKRPVRSEDYPNTVILQPVLIPKPLGYPVDLSTFQPKYNVKIDTYSNTVLLGITLPPPEDVRVMFEASFDARLFDAPADETKFDALGFDQTKFTAH